jgi:hypothetical protein
MGIFDKNIWRKPPTDKANKAATLTAAGMLVTGSLFASSKAHASTTDAITDELMKVVKPIFDKIFGQMMEGIMGTINKSESEVAVSIGKSVDASIEVRKLAHNNELRDQTRITTDYCVDEEASKRFKEASITQKSTFEGFQKKSADDAVAQNNAWFGKKTSAFEDVESRVVVDKDGKKKLDFSKATNVNKLRNASADSGGGQVPSMAKDFTTADQITQAKKIADTIFTPLVIDQKEQIKVQLEEGDARSLVQTKGILGTNSRRNNFQAVFYKQISDRTAQEEGESVYSGFEKRLDETYYNNEYFDDLSSQNAPTPVYGAVLRETTFGNAIALKRHELNVQRTAMLYTLLADEMSVLSARAASQYNAVINRR